METKITCPICFTDTQCFEDTQEKFSSYMCFHCGFTSNSTYKSNTKEFQVANDGATQLMREVSFYDVDRDITWFPSVVNMGNLGVIYPDGTKTNWTYKFAKVRKLTENEQKDPKYENYSEILDVDNASEFGQYEFIDALREMGVIQEV